MKRSCFSFLNNWKQDDERKPLLVHGARQVGKTYLIREFGRTFSNVVEINFDSMPQYKRMFEADLNPQRIIRDISLLSAKKIVPGETLLFFDEIQHVPAAISSLRYFYEEMPSLHVVAAGSLLEFILESVGVPVGRVSMLYMYPLSFGEFLVASGHGKLFEEILFHDYSVPISYVIHSNLLRSVGEYFAVGGMPAAIRSWIQHHDFKRVSREHTDITESYRQDFERYAKKHQQKYVDLIFNTVPAHIGRKFKYAAIADHIRKRELAPAFNLLEKAGVVHRITYSSGQGVPLGVGADPERFKPLFLDIALAQSLLGLDVRDFILAPDTAIANKGGIAEAFIGQELLAVQPSSRKHHLHYWYREASGSTAEVDYLMATGNTVIPIEVKSGAAGRMRSLKLFLSERPQTPYALRFWAGNYVVNDTIRSYPLYAVAAATGLDSEIVQYLCAE